MQRMRLSLVVRLVGAFVVFAGATYCLITLRDPVPALSRAIDDRHAYLATTLLVLAPILLAWHVVLLVAEVRRVRAAIPYAAVRQR